MIRRLLLLLLMLLAAPAAAQTFPQLTGRVVDGAGLLSPAQEAELAGKLEALERASTRQLVVATVPSLEGYEIEDYGYRLGRHWGIGQSEANNGIVLLVAPNERKVRIEVGYGLEGIMTDALSSQVIQQLILPRFREGDYPGGIAAGADAIIAQLQAPPELAEQRAIQAAEGAAGAASSGGGEEGFTVAPLVVWLLVIGVFVLPLIINGIRDDHHGRRYRRRRRGVDPVVIWGGGWGGGWSSGGGGSSWGGGGGFSGGGGSFGGGGASGGW